jgi:hypothetical protein
MDYWIRPDGKVCFHIYRKTIKENVTHGNTLGGMEGILIAVREMMIDDDNVLKLMRGLKSIV